MIGGETAYDVEPRVYKVEDQFTLPESAKTGEYILALAILDPAAMLPSARFDDPATDTTIHYAFASESPP